VQILSKHFQWPNVTADYDKNHSICGATYGNSGIVVNDIKKANCSRCKHNYAQKLKDYKALKKLFDSLEADDPVSDLVVKSEEPK
jgi:hypothetical protein